MGNPLKPSRLVGSLVRVAKAGHPSFVWGSPGIAKTAIINNVVGPTLGLDVWDFRVNSKEPVDLRGLPVPVKVHTTDGEVHQTTWATPDDLPRVPALIFIDELNTALPSMHAPLYQICQERRLGNWVAHPDTRIIAAGNRESDRAVAHKMSTALLTRFVHFDMEPDLEDWIAWAIANDTIDPVFIAFLRFRPELFNKFDPASPRTSPIPRTIHMASDIYRQNPPDDTIQDELGGAVGDGFASEFLGFLSIWRHLPDIDAILDNPSSFTAPTGKDAPSVRFAVAAAISFKMDRDNIANALRVLDKLGEEFAVFATSDALRRNPGIRAGSLDFAKWGRRIADLLG